MLFRSPFDLETTRPAQHFLEVIYVFDWLRQHYPDSRIIVMGVSYGGFMATQLTKYRSFEKLVLRAPTIYKPATFYNLNVAVKSPEAMAAGMAFKKDAEALAKHPLLARASNFKGQTLVIVHEQDERVPSETTDAHIHAFGAETYVAKGFPHSFSGVPADKIADYEKTLSTWLLK